ncbi:Rh158 [macacine betaherpesvirus 3]|nr:Rh158 [macacine betaherpesvirus 3]
MQHFDFYTSFINVTFAIFLFSCLTVSNGTKTEYCECVNVTLFTFIPRNTLYLQPLAPDENCTKQEVIAVLQNNTRTCLNPNALAIRVFFHKLFFRITKNEDGLYEVINTRLELPSWNITRKYYRQYLQRKVNSENAKILSRMIL